MATRADAAWARRMALGEEGSPVDAVHVDARPSKSIVARAPVRTQFHERQHGGCACGHQTVDRLLRRRAKSLHIFCACIYQQMSFTAAHCRARRDWDLTHMLLGNLGGCGMCNAWLRSRLHRRPGRTRSIGFSDSLHELCKSKFVIKLTSTMLLMTSSPQPDCALAATSPAMQTAKRSIAC